MSIEAMKQALEALETERDKYMEWGDEDGAPEEVYDAITALRTAIEQAQKQEPCAFTENPSGCYRIRCQLGGKCVDDDMSFRTSPPQRQPLTDEHRRELISKTWSEYLRGDGDDSFGWYLSEAIEAAHGIGKGEA